MIAPNETSSDDLPPRRSAPRAAPAAGRPRPRAGRAQAARPKLDHERVQVVERERVGVLAAVGQQPAEERGADEAVASATEIAWQNSMRAPLAEQRDDLVVERVPLQQRVERRRRARERPLHVRHPRAGRGVRGRDVARAIRSGIRLHRGDPGHLRDDARMPPISRGFRGRRDPDADPSRLPPGQYLTPRLPRAVGRPDAPRVALDEWSFTDPGRRRRAGRRGRGTELLALPAETFTVDIHCVTKWTKLDTTWNGVSVDTLLEGVDTEAEYVDRLVRRRLHDEPAARGPHRRARRGSPTSSTASRSSPSTAARRGCSSRTCTSGRAPSGCAAWR